VSEFATLIGAGVDTDQTDPAPFAKRAPDSSLPGAADACPPLTPHRDAEPFETLRARAAALTPPPRAVLVTVGDPAAAGGRLSFARTLLTAGGIDVDVGALSDVDPDGAFVILCGTDAGYAAQAPDAARQLKAAGARQVWLAGRPSELEAALQEAGVDDFIFAGADVVAKLDRALTALER
jgi:methylmalonyl-CoA mutase